MPNPVRWARNMRALWGVPRPLCAVPFWPRIAIVSTIPEQLVILSHKLETTKTHFIDNRTCGCSGDQGVCHVDHVLYGGGRYEGWLAVFSSRSKSNWILSLTKKAVDMEPRLELPDYDLRGRTLEVWRKGGDKRSQMKAHLRNDPPRDAGLDPCPDVRVLIERLWEAEDRKAPYRKKARGYEALTDNAAANPILERSSGIVPTVGDVVATLLPNS